MTTKRQAQFFTKLPALKRMIYNYETFHKDCTVLHESSSFTKEAIDALRGWSPTRQTLILRGRSNMGKTELAKAVLNEMCEQPPLLCGNLNKLTVHAKGQGIIFDDMNFSLISRPKAIALLDTENDRDIRILFGIHTIPAQTRKIITTNEPLEELLNFTGDAELDEAIRRRIHVVDLTDLGKLYREEPDEDSSEESDCSDSEESSCE